MADRPPPPDPAGSDRNRASGNRDETSPRRWSGATFAQLMRASTGGTTGAPRDGPVDEPAEFDFDDPDQCRFGDYQLRALLGGGGVGRIYRAYQHSLDREVALKLLSNGVWSPPEIVARLRREARDAAGLKHPNIVTIYDVGEQHGRIYYTMELVEGDSLREHLLRHGPLPPREAATLLQVLAEATDYAHRMGVLHLDLNPANVLLDTDGTPKITDFGLARRVLDGDSVANDCISGTPGYIAPEQVQLQRGRLCAATDVWGLGTVLYEVLTGQPPFEADSVEATMELVLRGRVRDPRRYRRDLPRDLQAICLHCLHKRPIARYASARGLADDLGRYLEGREVHVRPLHPFERAWRWTSREPMLASATALTLLSLAVALAAVLVIAQRA